MSNSPPQDIQSQVELTGASVIRRLRGIVSPAGKKGLWLRHLSDQRLAEVYHRLRIGQSVNRVVVMAQKEWGIMKSSNIKSLSRGMAKFRDEIIGDVDLDTVKTPEHRKENAAKKKRARYLVNKLDGLGVLRWTIEKQAERLQMYLEKEAATQFPFKQAEDTVKNLGGLIDTYMKYQVELGLLELKPQEFNVNIKHKFEALLGQGVVTDDGARMAAATHRFLELAEKSAVLMEVGVDGTCVLREVENEVL